MRYKFTVPQLLILKIQTFFYDRSLIEGLYVSQIVCLCACVCDDDDAHSLNDKDVTDSLWNFPYTEISDPSLM